MRGMVVATSFGMTHFDEIWTYTNSGKSKQLDYCLVSLEHWKYVRSCRVLQDVDIGSDHRPSVLELMIGKGTRKKLARRKKHIVSWTSGADYTESLQKRLPDEVVGRSGIVADRLHALQDVVLASVRATSQTEPAPHALPDEELQY